MSERVRFEGEVKKILFQNPENGYTVCVLDANGTEVTLTGVLPSLCAGEYLRADATLATHPAYGKQYRVERFEKELPQSNDAILRYLASRAIKGIGPKSAARIVERFGEDTLSVLENSPEMLSSIKGITPKKAAEIGRQFRDQFGLRQVLIFFGTTFGMKTSLSIYQTLGAGAVELVRKNPYLLCEKVRGVGFARADEFARGIGYGLTSPERLCAGLLYALQEAFWNSGNVYLPRDRLVRAGESLLKAPEKALNEAITCLLEDGKIVQSGDHRLYLPFALSLEAEAATRLVQLSQIRLLRRIPDAEKLLEETEREEGISYAPAQKQAILNAARYPFSIITGGPGTGKTTVIRAIVKIFSALGHRILLAAPTGRAAKRMAEKAHHPAKTLHRALEMEYSASEDAPARYGRDEHEPLDEELIVLDEVSMLDLPLFTSFLRAARPGSRVVFIGDADQLPSVGPGDVLHDLIESKAFPVTVLNEIFRQSEGSSIVRYAHEICSGKPHTLRENEGDLFFLKRVGPKACADTVCELLSARLPRSYGKEVLESCQVLCASRRGEAGSERLNVRLQAALNPPSPEKAELRFGDRIFREGDRVMQIKNDYDLDYTAPGEEGRGVFNGDVGVIETVDLKEETVSVRFEDRLVRYAYPLLEELEHAFAMTVHKSQGSEYGTVLFCLTSAPPMLQNRALFYTAVTRAKTRLILIGEAGYAAIMAKNDAPSGRYSALSERLEAAQ